MPIPDNKRTLQGSSSAATQLRVTKRVAPRPNGKIQVRSSPSYGAKPRPLHNGRLACYQNAVLHILHRIRQYTDLRLIEGDKTTLSDQLACVLRQMSIRRDRPIQLFRFRPACGRILQDYFDGHTQQAALEFSKELIRVLKNESPLLAGLFDLDFKEQRACRRCNTVKEAVFSDFSLDAPSIGAAVMLRGLIFSTMTTGSDFTERACDKCGTKGLWKDVPGWTFSGRRQLTVILVLPIPRECLDGTEQVKVPTHVDVSGSNFTMQSLDGSDVRYDLFGVIENHGEEIATSHYTALVKGGNTWYSCDDSERTGVTELGVDELQGHGQAKVCFIRKRKE